MEKGIIEEINRNRELMGMLNEWSFLGFGTDSDIKISYPLPHKVDSIDGGRFKDPRDGGSREHDGLDFPCETGTEVSVVADGVVQTATSDDGGNCGGTVVVKHDKFVTIYCHLSKIMVSRGDSVSQGDVVGLSGGGLNDPGRGHSSGPHLHFGLRVNGVAVDPKPYVDEASVLDTKTKYDQFLDKEVKGKKLGDWIKSGKMALAGGLSWMTYDEIKNKLNSGIESAKRTYNDLMNSKIEGEDVKDHLKDKVTTEKPKESFTAADVRYSYPCLSEMSVSQLFLNKEDETPVPADKVLKPGDSLYYREFSTKFKTPDGKPINIKITFDKVDGKIVGKFDDGKILKC